MKKLVLVILVIVIAVSMLTACGGDKNVDADFKSAEEFEAALNNGEDLSGKTVTFTVSDFKPDSAFGYNMIAGEHLNFCSEKNPNAKTGDTVTVKVKEVASMLGSWIISYDKVK